MNDKCAAGTGKFFEAMARTFEIDLETFSRLSLTADKSIPVTSQCSVFAESEVISLIAQKKPPAEIALGIQESVARRCYVLLRKVGSREKVTISGGCAKNSGLVKAFTGIARMNIAQVSIDPQLMGALGAAVLAKKRA
jgi:predicted CoA-substrate-specific enzyme activase